MVEMIHPATPVTSENNPLSMSFQLPEQHVIFHMLPCGQTHCYGPLVFISSNGSDKTDSGKLILALQYVLYPHDHPFAF